MEAAPPELVDENAPVVVTLPMLAKANVAPMCNDVAPPVKDTVIAVAPTPPQAVPEDAVPLAMLVGTAIVSALALATVAAEQETSMLTPFAPVMSI